MDEKIIITDNDYNSILTNTIAVIDGARLNIARVINTNVVTAYWKIGGILHERKIESKHGSSVVNRLSEDLKERYPEIGLSPRQLWNMKKFYERFCSSDPKLLHSVAVLPWSGILLLINKQLNDDQVLYYATQTVQKGWSRDLLLNAIKMQMYERDNKSVLPDNNFQAVLPAEQATYANEVFKSSYNLGFLGVTEPIKELELEQRIVEKVKLFLLEFGKGFTYIGNQYVLEYNGKESRVDLLLYHRKLRCLVAVDLKIGEFKPEYAGKMNYYLSLLDRLERGEDENHSIGIILCAEKDHVEVELALEDMGKPIGVADYRLLIPKDELKALIEDEMKNFSQKL